MEITDSAKRKMMLAYTDDVRGVIIGGFTRHYAFWTAKYDNLLRLPPYRFAGGSFDNDAEAEAWVKTHYPREYVMGVEMRCFD